MARRIGILESYQQDTDQPERFEKKTVARYLLRKLLAKPISESVIKMLPIRPAEVSSYRLPAEPRRYIPEKMPPLNVPGVYFEEPRSEQWRRDHRTAWQSWPTQLVQS